MKRVKEKEKNREIKLIFIIIILSIEPKKQFDHD